MLWWTIQNLLTAGLMAGVVWLLCRSCRIGAVGRHALWLVVLIKLLTPPLIAWPWAVRDPLSRLLRAPTESLTAAIATPSNALQLLPPVVVGAESPTPTDYAPPDAAKSPAMASVGAATASPPAAATSPVSNPSAKPTAAVPVPVAVWLAKSLPWAGILWLGGGILFGAIHLARIARMIRLRRHSQPADAALLERIGIISERLGLRPVQTRVAPGIRSPLVWCLLRREMLWPAALPEMAELSIRGLIVHELAHLKRRDHWVGWLELAAGCVWWWNPLYWYVRHQLRENAELACDAWVVQTLPDGRRAYAEGLLAVCESTSGMCQSTAESSLGVSRHKSRPPTPMPVLGVGGGSRRIIERRLAMILCERIPLHIPRMGWLMIGLLTAGTLPAWSQKVVDRSSESAAPEAPVHMQVVGVARAEQSPLPGDAQELIAGFEQQEAQTRAEIEKQVTALHEQLIAHLRDLQDRYTKAGQLDEAVAIRDQIRQMTGYARRTAFVPQVIRPIPDPGNAAQLRGQINKQILIMVTGSTDGPVWGHGIYSDDSTIAAAAVHAGILKSGESGVVSLTILPGQNQYVGTTSNGVSSLDYGPWPGSYSIDGAAALRIYPDPRGAGNGPRLDGQGSNTVAPNRGGVNLPYSFDSTYRIERDNGSWAHRVPLAWPQDDANSGQPSLDAFRNDAATTAKAGRPLVLEWLVTGTTTGTVWGTDVYTDDSSIGAAAVHAGVLHDGEQGWVRITLMPDMGKYTGSERNGVTSEDWGVWGGCFRIERGNPPAGAPGGAAEPVPGAPQVPSALPRATIAPTTEVAPPATIEPAPVTPPATIEPFQTDGSGAPTAPGGAPAATEVQRR